MLRNLFARHEDSHTLLQSPDATQSSRAQAQAQEWARLGQIAVPQAGPAATRYMMPGRSLSPVAKAAVARITGNPVVVASSSELPLLNKPITSRDLHVALQRYLSSADDGKVVPLFADRGRGTT